MLFVDLSQVLIFHTTSNTLKWLDFNVMTMTSIQLQLKDWTVIVVALLCCLEFLYYSHGWMNE